MLGWNRLIKEPGKIRLEIVSSILLMLLKALQTVCSIGGIGGILFFVFLFFQKTPFNWLPIAAGFGLHILANIIGLMHTILKSLDMRYVFDVQAQTLHIEYPQSDYDFLPRAIPFSHIESLRLLCLRPRQSLANWQLELIMDDGKFYPLTTFKSKEKARCIIQELQGAMNCSFRESTASEHSFKAYKQLFLQQFQSAPQAGKGNSIP